MTQHHRRLNSTETLANKSPALEALYHDLDAFINELSLEGDSTSNDGTTPDNQPCPVEPSKHEIMKRDDKTPSRSDSLSKDLPLSNYNKSKPVQRDSTDECVPSIKRNDDSQRSSRDSPSLEQTQDTVDSTPSRLSPSLVRVASAPQNTAHMQRRQHANDLIARISGEEQLPMSRSSSLSNQNGGNGGHRHPFSAPTSPLSNRIPEEWSEEQEAVVNTALLSELAENFVKHVRHLNEHRRMFCTAEYPLSFTGQEAIDIIEDWLLDSASAALSRDVAKAFMRTTPSLISPISYSEKSIKRNTIYKSITEIYTLNEDTLKQGFPQGVFAPLTQCYSQSCLPGNGGCYAPLCPNRPASGDGERPCLARQGSLKSSASSHDTSFSRAWSATISRDILNNTPPSEVKRQEAIHELIYTEEDYVRDLQLLHELYALPLRTAQCLDVDRRDAFCDNVFNNYADLLEIHKDLCRDLRDHQSECQAQGGFVDKVGDIMLRHLSRFMGTYSKYGPHVILAEYAVKKEASNNMLFHNFIHEKEKMAECRKLPFRHFLILPVTRLQRYPLLLNAILNKTPDDHPDKAPLTQCVDMLRSVAREMDKRTEKTKEILHIYEVNDAIHYKPNEPRPDLKLTEPGRKLVHEGVLVRRQHMGVETTELHVFLFDHILLFTRKRKGQNDSVEYHMSKRPIPLELLYMQEATEGSALGLKSSSTGTATTMTSALPLPSSPFGSGYPIHIQHLGRNGVDHLVYAESAASRMTWKARIVEAKAMLSQRTAENQVFEMRSLSDTTFGGSANHGRITCSIPFTGTNGIRMIAIGTTTGVWMGVEGDTNSVTHVLSLSEITQIAVLEEEHILVVLADKTLYSYALEPLDPTAQMPGKKITERHCQKIAQNISYFQAGVCDGRTLVIAMKKRGIDSHFRAFEPVCGDLRDPKNAKYLTAKSGLFSKQPPSWFRVYKEFYIGAVSFAIHLLKARVVVVCARGFEIIDLENLSMNRNLPDITHPDFAMIHQRSEVVKPLGMFRCGEHYLLCYNEFAFRVDNHGSLIPNSWYEWEGSPQGVGFSYPYVIGFDTRFIEVRHAETGQVVQIFAGENIRLLQFTVGPFSPVIHGCMTHPFKPEYQYVFQLVGTFPPSL